VSPSDCLGERRVNEAWQSGATGDAAVGVVDAASGWHVDAVSGRPRLAPLVTL
jgi:hypothetical protein